MKLITPEQGGIPSDAIERFLKALEKAGLSTHNIIIERSGDILFEKYYPPFNADYLHREYSQSKSLVALAIGFAAQDGLLDLDDPIGKYFEKETADIPDPAMAAQTVRQMLMMSTPKSGEYWFSARTDDRVRHYFETTRTTAVPGSRFQYDSTGSFVLGAMVERLTGMSFIDYLRKKLFDRIGVSTELTCLKCPGGHSWGDSAVLAKARDMMKLCRFVLDVGKVGDEQLLDAEFIKEATSALIPTAGIESRRRSSYGYGYLIWKLRGGFYFNGMGCQFSIAVPEKDMILIYNGDNQGIDDAGDIIVDSFYDLIVSAAGEPLPENPPAKTSLDAYAGSLILMAAIGEKNSPLANEINGKLWTLNENPMGIKTLRLTFGDECRLEYANAQGDKAIGFKMCENSFGVFPEEGYSREVGSVYCQGNYYKCAASAAWKDERTLLIDVQIIDEYFGRLWITLSFDGGRIAVEMKKVAEDFLSTYSGSATGACLD